MSERLDLTNSNSMAIDTDNSNNSNDNNNSSSSSNSNSNSIGNTTITTTNHYNADARDIYTCPLADGERASCEHLSTYVSSYQGFLECRIYKDGFVCLDCYEKIKLHNNKLGISIKSDLSLTNSITESNGITTFTTHTISKNCQNQSSSSSKCSLNSSPSSMSSEVVYITQTGPWFWL